jgi:hypothetical protein
MHRRSPPSSDGTAAGSGEGDGKAKRKAARQRSKADGGPSKRARKQKRNARVDDDQPKDGELREQDGVGKGDTVLIERIERNAAVESEQGLDGEKWERERKKGHNDGLGRPPQPTDVGGEADSSEDEEDEQSDKLGVWDSQSHLSVETTALVLMSAYER